MAEILPPERQIEEVVKNNLEVSDTLDDFHAEQGRFTRSGFELVNPGLVVYLQFMSEMLSTREQDPEAVYKVSLEAFNFAHLASELVAPGKVRLAIDSHLASLEEFLDSEEQLCAKILDDANDYLENRPYVAGLIHGSMEDIDPTGDHILVAETVAATTFMQIESGEREGYIDELSSEFAAEIEHVSKHGGLEDLI